MIILHAGIIDSQLCIWGETSTQSQKPRVRTRQPRRSPLDADQPQLRVALECAGLRLEDSRRVSQITAWLPSVHDTPLPSSGIIADLPSIKGQPELTPWTVTGFLLSGAESINFLAGCRGREVLAPGVIAAREIAFWVTAMRFAGALVARQQYLPGVVRNRGFHARWEPVLTAADQSRLNKLAQAMPDVARALSFTAAAPPDESKNSVLSRFVVVVVDSLVRTSVTGSGGSRRGQEQDHEFDSIHDQWLHALRSSDPRMQGNATELERLHAEINDWRRPIWISGSAPFRLCFRLEEPRQSNGRSDDWKVRYLLQATDDPSLLLPTQELWRPGKRAAMVINRRGFNAREYFLASLGQASALCPKVEESLRQQAPEGYQLDTAGAHRFLTEKAQALEQAGFGVLLPAWWTRKGTRLRLSSRARVKTPKMQSSAGLSLDQIMNVEWQVALGDETLSRAELTELARIKAPLVRLRGQWVQVNGDEIQAALDFWKRKAEGQETLRDLVYMALGSGETAGGLPVEGVDASGWLDVLLKQLEEGERLELIKSPRRFNGTLRPYQQRGYSWLSFLTRWGLGACLADDMGLGKTVQTLALIQRNWAASDRRPVLLICPTSVTTNWLKEANRFTPGLPAIVHHGTRRGRGSAFKEQAEKQALVISSYSLLHRDCDIFKNVSWAAVILDEAQNIKNAETKQARAARSLKPSYRIALTGTPVENNVGDLWSIMEFLNPGLLGSQAEFKRSFFLPIQTLGDRGAVDRLKKVTGPFILRRLKTDKSVITDLPEKMEMKVFCTLTKEQASLYEAVVKDVTEQLDEAEGIQRKGLVLATLTRLKQVCNHPAQFLGDNSPVAGRSGKLARLAEMMEEALQTGDRALVFSQFAEMGELLKRHLEETFGREVLFLHGKVVKKKRDVMIERFQDENGPPIFVLSLKAGGTGLNLTRANHVFHFDRWWNPAVEDQATDRAFRIGQTRNVQVHKFICAGTLEEKIDEMIERKKEIAGRVVGTGEGWLTELSTSELKELFALRQEAVGE